MDFLSSMFNQVEAKFRLVVDAAPNGIIVVSRSGLIVLANTHLEALFGYLRGELVGKPIETLVPERYRAEHPQHREGFFANPHARAMGAGRDLFGRRKDGSEFPVEIGLNPLPGEDEVFVLASVIDITERKRAEERYRLAVEGVKDYAIVTLDAHGKITSWNAGAERIMRYRPEQILGHHCSCFYPRDTGGDGWPERELNLAATEGRFEDEGWRLRSDGSKFWGNVVITAIRDHTGALIGFSQIMRDLTERKLSEERFRLLVDAAPNGMLMVGADGKILLVNALTEKLFGYQKKELLGQSIEILVPERFRADHPEHREGFFANPQARATGARRELFGRRQDGSEFPVEIGLNPIWTESGLVVLAAIIDISERKMREAEIQQKNRDLETLLHVTSHDLREPLRAIQNFGRLVMSGTRQDWMKRARTFCGESCAAPTASTSC